MTKLAAVPTHDATGFFEPWEAAIGSYDDLMSFVSKTYARWSAAHRVFAWRGAVNSTWSFHSSLYRRVWWTNPDSVPDERTILAREGLILRRAHQWGLHRGDGGRLSILEQLAMMQHFGAPTRLIDISFNPLIAAWFAVQADPVNDEADGRLFAIDVTRRLISESDDFRRWEDARVRPWKPKDEKSNSGKEPEIPSSLWRTSAWAWKPPGFLGRISRQNGGFLFGGVPAAVMPPGGSGPFQVPRGRKPTDGRWRIESVRKNTSVALRFHVAQAKAGGVSEAGQPAFTARVAAKAKADIRKRLERLFGYNTASLYGDYPGFAQFATPELVTHPD